MSLRRDIRDGVLILTIDRPAARNALDAETQQELLEEWRRFRDDDALRVAVLTGAGKEAFCAGADLKELGAFYRSMNPFQRRERGERDPGLGAITRNFDPRKPTIAAVNGACLAGGLELALNRRVSACPKCVEASCLVPAVRSACRVPCRSAWPWR
jgi:enoyl-CoA hydratase/carnithine racemase